MHGPINVKFSYILSNSFSNVIRSVGATYQTFTDTVKFAVAKNVIIANSSYVT